MDIEPAMGLGPGVGFLAAPVCERVDLEACSGNVSRWCLVPSVDLSESSPVRWVGWTFALGNGCG